MKRYNVSLIKTGLVLKEGLRIQVTTSTGVLYFSNDEELETIMDAECKKLGLGYSYSCEEDFPFGSVEEFINEAIQNFKTKL